MSVSRHTVRAFRTTRAAAVDLSRVWSYNTCATGAPCSGDGRMYTAASTSPRRTRSTAFAWSGRITTRTFVRGLVGRFVRVNDVRATAASPDAITRYGVIVARRPKNATCALPTAIAGKMHAGARISHAMVR